MNAAASARPIQVRVAHLPCPPDTQLPYPEPERTHPPLRRHSVDAASTEASESDPDNFTHDPLYDMISIMGAQMAAEGLEIKDVLALTLYKRVLTHYPRDRMGAFLKILRECSKDYGM